MNIHILHNLREEPWGGGNQFLKALRSQWRKQGYYCETPKDADAILINSFPFGAEYLFDELFNVKKTYPEKIVVYRLDGPISSIRHKDQKIDKIICEWNHVIADGIIFQSAWSQEKNEKDFHVSSLYKTVIHNAPDPTIFFPKKERAQKRNRIRLITTSWSANLRKGFDIYTYLDEHLDMTKYQMTFIGNSPVSFKHIQMIAPVDSKTLATILREHDLFITASKSDPCSNALIEALSCGLPAIVFNDGGHPELVQNGGELFEGTHDILKKIDLVANNLERYQEQLPVFDLRSVANRYCQFAHHIKQETHEGRYVPKRANRMGLLKLKSMILCWKTKNMWKKLIGSIS